MLIGSWENRILEKALFVAATLAEVEIANYPFATGKPLWRVLVSKLKMPPVNSKTSNRAAACAAGISFCSSVMLDVPLRVPGAYQGLRHGNQFLDDLRYTDAALIPYHRYFRFQITR